ncbi:sigma-70 family RNA polymerase sigma factor [Micromonospora sp. NBC_01796]|uniref:sigma-70 family RNA polymerase sigma factor n=1 Tax=Micromonospora sp. NBC_01796 TaxID=2975987 RepID=UPI002DDAD638|nr:sigma-70 family RNA polymerase sigma factor [Micromonospora sp. NBC_01796]WSA85143.1 sigma-70 family RNA polymerase sigma factor [Micromonospora sp. NBC_01796]
MRTAVDPALVSAARTGDEDALAALVAEAMPLVYNVVGKALHGSSDVDDVVQETMLRVVRGIAGLKDPECFRAWVISIAYRQMQDRGRSIRVATALGPLVGDVSQWPDPAGDFVDSTMFRLHLSVERRETHEAARWLTTEDQRVLRLWWREAAGMLTRADLADELGLTTGHAAVRVQRVKAQLVLARTLLRAWHAIPRCAALTVAAAKLGGPSDPRWLKHLGRHVRRCEVCLAHERELIPAEHLLAGANLAPMLAGLAGSAGVSATVGGAVAPVWGTAWDLVQRAVRYLMAHLLPVGGVVAVATTTVFVYAVSYPPYQDGGPDLAIPSAEATGGGSVGAPTPGPATPAAPNPPPVGGFDGVTTASYYVAPDGSDANPGDLDRPFATLGKATAVVRPGQTIALRGGTYRPTRSVEITTSGTADQRIVLSNYRDEIPVIDASGIPAGASYVTQRASYWTVQGLAVRGAPEHAYVCRSCSYNVFRAVSLHDNGQTGLLLRDRDTIGNLVVDSDFFGNHDNPTNGEYADGLGIEYGSGTGNVVRNCRLYENADDGLGLHEFTSPVTIEHTWSFGNGLNRWGIAPFDGDGYGFKLGGGTRPGPVDHVITGSAAWDNAGYGFTESGNTGALTVRGNTAFRNGKTGFAFERSTSFLRQNLAVGNGRESTLGDGVDAADNSWDQDGWSDAALLTTDPASAVAPRSPDGRLPATTFLTNTRDKRVGAAMTPVG